MAERAGSKTYQFLGGSHDGEPLILPDDLKIGFVMAIEMRTADALGNQTHTGKKEVYKLQPDGKFHYLNYVKKPGDK